MKRHEMHYDVHTDAVVVGRVPALPVQVALDALSATDPLERTREIFAENTLAAQALAAASPSLFSAVRDWIDGRPLRNPKTPLRALAYLLRMSSRPTPFGLCAGIGEVTIGSSTTLAVDDRVDVRRSYTRPDMQVLLDLADSLERTPARGSIRYTTNPCILERGGRLYVTNVALANIAVTNGAPLAQQRAVSLKATEAVSMVLSSCEAPTPHDVIAGALSARFNASPTESAHLVDQLIRAGALISELRPSALGDPVSYLADRFDALQAPFAVPLRGALIAAADLDARPLLERTADDYSRVHAHFSELSPNAPANCLQIDLRSVFRGALGSGVLEDVEQFVEFALRSGPTIGFSKMRERFLERYEGTERMVPLLELVDENIGIGAPEGLTTYEESTHERDALLVRLACDASRTGSEEIVLDEASCEIIAPAKIDGAVLPSIEVGFQIVASCHEDIDAGRYLIVPSGFSLSNGAAKSLGRFSSLFGDDFVHRMGDAARRSGDGSTLRAEFVYPPQDARAFNVSTRPQLYDCQLSVGTGAPAHGEAIPLKDLWVGIDDDRFFLWSVSRGCRVDVCETHAFATAFQAPDVCRFLALVRLDGTRQLSAFDWGAAAGFTYLPRVRVGRTVLALRRWLLTKSDVSAAGLTTMRSDWNLPRYVYLCEDDKRLLIDLDSPVSRDLLADQATDDTAVVLTEALPTPDQTWLNSSAGSHYIEFVAQGALALQAGAPPEVPPAQPAIVESRPAYGPGSDWTYLKLYVGKQAANGMLLASISPLVGELQQAGIVDRWFFLRYGDPQFHLRLRLHAMPGKAPELRECVLHAAEHWLSQNALLRYAVETYSPELERYGGVLGLPLVEEFFSYDSELCIGLLGQNPGSTDQLVSVATASFDEYVRMDPRIEALMLRAFAGFAKEKMSQVDRDILRSASMSLATDHAIALLGGALLGKNAEKRIGDLVHMRCNRLGLDGEAERRVYLLLKALALGRGARKKVRESEIRPAYATHP